MRKIFLVLVLILSSLASKAQENINYTVVEDTGNYAFAQFVLSEFYNDLANNALEQKIELFYGDDSKPIKDQASIDSVFFKYEFVQIINPENPVDPYDLIDTFFSYRNEYTNMLECWIQNERFYFKTFIGLNYSVLSVSIKHLRPIKFSEILISALTYNTIESKNQTRVDELIVSYFQKLRLKIYHQVMQKEIAYYSSPFCKKTDKMKWVDINSHPFIDRINVQIINPLNPTDPYDLIDTVIIQITDSLNLNSSIFASEFNPDGKSKLNAFALCENEDSFRETLMTYSGTKNLPWIKWNDIEDILGKKHTQNLIQNYIWHTTKGAQN